MKKIFFPILFFSLALLQSCQDFNEKNFPGYDLNTRPAQVTTATYQLTNDDYQTISNIIKANATSRFASDSILIAATDHTKAYKDSVIALEKDTFNNEIIHATSILSNRSFSATEQASIYIKAAMPTLYKYADPSSALAITYRTTESIDPIAYNVVYKDSILAADYTTMGTGTGKPGVGDFSKDTDPKLFLPTYCKTKHTYAVANEVAKVTFMWFVNKTTIIPLVRYYKYDGTNWNETGKTDQFIKGSDLSWVFDPTVTFIASKDDYLKVLTYMYNKFLNLGGVAPVAPQTFPDTLKFMFPIPELEGYNGWTSKSVGRFVINWKYPPSGTSLANVYSEYFFGLAWTYPDVNVTSTSRVYADDIELHNYFKDINDSTSLSPVDKNIAKTAFIEQRAIQGIALIISLKYPNLPTQVNGVNQFVQVKLDEYDGGHNYWIYKYQCMEAGKYQYISRTKWK